MIKISKGFTMIELLIVIAIIGILVALSAMGFQGSFESTRDSQRKSDLKQFQASLEQFANKNNGLYPVRATATNGTTLCGYLGLTGCPIDPKNNPSSSFEYRYETDGTLSDGSARATKYILWTRLEDPLSPQTHFIICSNGKSAVTGTGVPAGGTCPLP